MNLFLEQLNELGLAQSEAARLLSVNDRTLRRWIAEPSEVPGPAMQAVSAWVRLQRRGLAWRPDSEPIGESEAEIADQVARLREHNIALEAMLREVEKRGGPKHQFDVDLKKKKAWNEKIEVGFYALKNGGFSPSNYRRLDQRFNRERDLPLLQDAYYSIAQAIGRAGPNWYLR